MLLENAHLFEKYIGNNKLNQNSVCFTVDMISIEMILKWTVSLQSLTLNILEENEYNLTAYKAAMWLNIVFLNGSGTGNPWINVSLD